MMLGDLSRVLAPPRRPSRTKYDRALIEGAVGACLPDDYFEFVDAYGAGCVDDFLWVLVPACSNPHLDLWTQSRRQAEVLDEVRRQPDSDVPWEPFPRPGGLLPWGISDNGDVCFWQTTGLARDWQVVVCDGRMFDWRKYNLSMSDFLHGVFSASLRCDVFPDDVPSEAPAFRVKGAE